MCVVQLLYNKALMAKVGLDAICAKLSRNAEMTSREVDSGSLLYPDDDDCITAVNKVDQCGGTASGPASVSRAVVERENAMMMTSCSVDRTTSLMDSGIDDEADAFDGDVADDGGAGRRSRRKNFLPRYVHDGLVTAGRASEPYHTADAAATSTTWSTAVENVEDDQTVLDLRTGRSSSALAPQASHSLAKFGNDTQDQILDLSVSRRGDSAPDGSNESKITGRSSAEGDLNEATDLRVYAANTMTELLHIYGLPDDQQSAATDLRKLIPPENSSETGTEVVRTVQHDVPCSVGWIHDREQVTVTPLSTSHVPDSIIEQTLEHTAGHTHLRGSCHDADLCRQTFYCWTSRLS